MSAFMEYIETQRAIEHGEQSNESEPVQRRTVEFVRKRSEYLAQVRRRLAQARGSEVSAAGFIDEYEHDAYLLPDGLHDFHDDDCFDVE